MRILIFASYFAPDTAIAAVRPFMFAKYLSLKGHRVTVIRSGEILASIDESYDYNDYDIEVISYLGEDSFAERYNRGEVTNKDFKRPKSRISFLPINIRKRVSKTYHTLFKYNDYRKEEKLSATYLSSMKNSIDALKARGKRFDVIFATYGRLENPYAAAYAKKVFGCPYILDLHDRIAHDSDFLLYLKQKKAEKECILAADCSITVTQAYCKDLRKEFPSSNVQCLYYGYDESQDFNVAEQDNLNNELSFCYTGSMYLGKLSVSPLFKSLSNLAKNGKISLKNIKFYYAGGEFEYIYSQAKYYGVESIMINMGYLDRTQIKKLQCKSDIYVVASRNKKVQDEIPGKFYEGIRAHKPILLLVTGDNKHGEMWELQEKYNYGHCYETAGEYEEEKLLCEYIVNVYTDALKGNHVQYSPKDDLFIDFKYDILTDKLEEIIEQLVDALK